MLGFFYVHNLECNNIDHWPHKMQVNCYTNKKEQPTAAL